MEAFMRALRFRVESAEGSCSLIRYISQIQWIHEDCWKFVELSESPGRV
jgi:hypothetical protein